MTKEELIKSLTLLKEQARTSGGNTFVWDINVYSFNFVIDSAIKALEQEPILDKVRAEINKLTVYYTTKDKGINLISQNAVNRICDKYKAESEE